MKAITIIGPSHMKMLDIEKPVITESDQVLMQVRAAGICGSDMYVAHGSNPYAVYSRAIGHEAAGEVGTAGTAVEDIKVGDGVASRPVIYYGECYACRSNHHSVCRDLKVLGCIVDGTFREYTVIERSQVYQYDKREMSYIRVALYEPYTIGSQADRYGNVRPGDMALVHGAGPINPVVADVTKSRGAMVTVSGPNENRLVMAAGFGADHMVNPMKENLDAPTTEVTKGEGVSMVFETARIPVLLEHAVEILSPASRLVAMTFGQTPIAVDFKTANAKESIILGTRRRMEKSPEMLGQLPNHPDWVDRLIAHVFLAEKREGAFAVLVNRGSGASKVVLIFD